LSIEETIRDTVEPKCDLSLFLQGVNMKKLTKNFNQEINHISYHLDKDKDEIYHYDLLMNNLERQILVSTGRKVNVLITESIFNGTKAKGEI